MSPHARALSVTLFQRPPGLEARLAYSVYARACFGANNCGYAAAEVTL